MKPVVHMQVYTEFRAKLRSVLVECIKLKKFSTDVNFAMVS